MTTAGELFDQWANAARDGNWEEARRIAAKHKLIASRNTISVFATSYHQLRHQWPQAFGIIEISPHVWRGIVDAEVQIEER